ncbi:MAG TPA: alanine--glyoxylate aminotransferase family protein [Verrucomicrobiae bacterium]|nr:alanine--glyoxylate aminotransferase family protein [Verrucomicrobiae bacterium]
MTSRSLLLTPGPVPIPEPVREVLAEPIFHHRTPRFRKIMLVVSERLRKVFRTECPVYTIAGSGSSGMEAAVANFHSEGDAVLVLDTGKFGERFAEIAQAYGLRPIVVKSEWGQSVDVEAVRTLLIQNPGIKSVFAQLCETSTGVVNDIEALGKIVRQTPALLIVDAIAGLCADRLETDAWGVDVVIAGSQKAMMLPPGLAFISESAKAKKRREEARLPRYYFDLARYEKSLAAGDTPFTPATGLVCAAEKALELILAEKLENIWWRCRKLGEYSRERLTGLGLRPFAKSPSSALTAALFPRGADGSKVLEILREEKNVTFAGGQDALKGRLLRAAHMGSITRQDLEEGFQALEEVLAGTRSDQLVSTSPY